MLLRRSALPSLLLAAAVLAAGCGDDDETAEAADDGPARMAVQVQVRPHGEQRWLERNTARPGDTLEYRVQVLNSGGEQARDVRVRDRLPRGVRLVFGSGTSQRLALSVANARPLRDGLFDSGLSTGPYPPRAGDYIEFRARVARDAAGTLRNTATVTSPAGADSDSATTVVR